MAYPNPSSTGKLSDDAEELLERIADPIGRPVVFLFGAALTMPERGKAGVPGVRDVATRIRDFLENRGGRQFDEAFALAQETGNYGDVYRKGFHALLRRKGQDAVNRVIREAVLDAHQPLDEDRRARALAGHPDEHREECQALLDGLKGWLPLRGSVAALGDILVQESARFGRVLTTNFDPLIEIAVKKAGGQARLTVLDRDGNPGQHRGTGTHVVHLHGYWFDADTLHTDVQISRERPNLQTTLRRWIERSFLVVLGYGGWDDVLMRSLCAVAEDTGAYPEIAWGFYGSRDPGIVDRLSPAGARAQFYEHVDMHELLPMLHARLRDSGRLRGSLADLHEASNASATSDGSASLHAWEYRTEGHWIPRAEQQQLLDKTLDENPRPILLLGGPGTGKSSLLRWLSAELHASGWWVLAIKADLIPHTIRNELELCEWLGHGRTRMRRVLQPLARKQRVCVIFDQLDAIASTVDTKTGRLVLLLQLFRQISDIEEVQVVASTRYFELRYDPRLRKLGEADLTRSLEVDGFPSETVASYWQIIKHKPLEPELIRARTPWAFRLMLELDDPESADSALLAAYWQQRVQSADVEFARQDELRALTGKLEAHESLWSEPPPGMSLDFWEKRGILTSTGGRYGFVHQSLFDYARAERIINDDDLVQVVLDRQDGLAVRPLLRATLRVLSGIEPQQYSRTMNTLWRTPNLRAHVRVLLVEHIGEQEAPSPKEVEWMREAIGFRGPGERGVRTAARSVVARSRMWFDQLRATLRQMMSTDLGGELVGVLASGWAFEPATIERWLEEAWTSGDAQIGWATEVMIRRQSWDDRSVELAIHLVNAGMSGDQAELVAYILSRHAPEHEARFLGRYALREWQDWFRRRTIDDPRSDNPWELGIRLDWERAAKRSPAQYLETIFRGLVRLARETTRNEPGQFRHDQHSYYTFATPRQLGRTDDVLLAVGTALATLAQTERESFWGWVDRLAPLDHDVIQSLVLRAMAHVVEQDSARIVAFLRADSRRWLLQRPLVAVLPKLAPHLDENQTAQLWEDIQTIDRNNLASFGRNPEHRRHLRTENEAYRVSLLSALAEAPLPDGALAAIARWSRRDETIEIHTSQVWTVNFVSPYSREQFARMSDTHLLAALERCPDGHRISAGRATEVTNEKMCVELQAFAKCHGPRALGLLRQLPDSGQFRAAATLLEGASESLDIEPDDLVDVIRHTWNRGFHSDLWFRQVCVRLLERRAHTLSEKSRATALQIVDEALSLDWNPSSYADADQRAEAEPDDQPLIRPSSPTYGIPNIFTALDAAVELRLATGDTDTAGWTAFLDLLEAQIERLPDACWRLFLPRGLWPGYALAGRWTAWLTRLFEHRPGVLSSSEGAHEIWRISGFADEPLIRGWLNVLRTSPWPSGARAADELTTMLACWGKHQGWARAVLDDWLTNSLEDHELGIVHGLVTIRNDCNSPAAVDWALVRFVKHASPGTINLLFDKLHSEGLRMTSAMLDVLLTLETRNHPIQPTVRASLMAGLSELLDARPDAVARAARHIAASEPIGAGLMRDDYLMSIAIGLHGYLKQRAVGMELFERWQEFDPGTARTALAESDGAYWAADDLDGMRTQSSRRQPLILYATASTSDRPLDLDLELKAVRRVIPDPSAFEHLPAVEKRELIAGLRKHEPTMLVFSGHHDPEMGLVLRGGDGETRFYLPLEDLIQIINTTCRQVPILVLNTCSVDNAKRLRDVAGAVVYSEQLVDDSNAREFLVNFLTGLFHGYSVDAAFNDARLMTDMPYAIEYEVGAGVRSSTIFKLCGSSRDRVAESVRSR